MSAQFCTPEAVPIPISVDDGWERMRSARWVRVGALRDDGGRLSSVPCRVVDRTGGRGVVLAIAADDPGYRTVLGQCVEATAEGTDPDGTSWSVTVTGRARVLHGEFDPGGSWGGQRWSVGRRWRYLFLPVDGLRGWRRMPAAVGPDVGPGRRGPMALQSAAVADDDRGVPPGRMTRSALTKESL